MSDFTEVKPSFSAPPLTATIPMAVLIVFIFRRYGVLTLAGVMVFASLLINAPATLDPSTWYFGRMGARRDGAATSLVPQRLDRIEVRGALGRVDPRGETDRDRDARRERERPERHHRRPPRQRRDDPRE